MARFLDEFKHAFAVNKYREDREIRLPEALERLARTVVDRRMEVPAIAFLETVRPLNFLAGQAMLAAWPLVGMAVDAEDFRKIAESLEDRRMIGVFITRIEDLAHEKIKAGA